MNTIEKQLAINYMTKQKTKKPEPNIEEYAHKIKLLGDRAMELVADENGESDPEEVQLLLDFTALLHQQLMDKYLEKESEESEIETNPELN